MAKLNAAKRNKLPDAAFAGPDRSYPVPDRGHAVAAKSRASAAVNAGRMSPATEAKIDSKADRVMGKGKGEMPARGERTETNKRTSEVRHPASHAEWEKLGND